MGKFVVIVLDGFGVGAMPDVPQVRPADCGANTCVHIFERTPDLKLPNLASLGLANIVGREFPGLPFATDATFGRAELMHDGADTFFGHQEIMGTRPAKPFGEPICNKIELIKKTLEDAGYHVRYYTGTSGKRLLIVNEACTVADNVECDPGQAFNVTAAILILRKSSRSVIWCAACRSCPASSPSAGAACTCRTCWMPLRNTAITSA
jgi:phosphopentomutase